MAGTTARTATATKLAVGTRRGTTTNAWPVVPFTGSSAQHIAVLPFNRESNTCSRNRLRTKLHTYWKIRTANKRSVLPGCGRTAHTEPVLPHHQGEPNCIRNATVLEKTYRCSTCGRSAMRSYRAQSAGTTVFQERATHAQDHPFWKNGTACTSERPGCDRTANTAPVLPFLF